MCTRFFLVRCSIARNSCCSWTRSHSAIQFFATALTLAFKTEKKEETLRKPHWNPPLLHPTILSEDSAPGYGDVYRRHEPIVNEHFDWDCIKTARRDNSLFSSDTPTGIVMQRRKQRIHSHCVRYNRYEEDLLHTLAWSSDDIVEHRQRLLDECGLWFEREDTHLIFFLPYGWLSVLVPNPMQTKNRILSSLFDAALVQLDIGSWKYKSEMKWHVPFWMYMSTLKWIHKHVLQRWTQQHKWSLHTNVQHLLLPTLVHLYTPTETNLGRWAETEGTWILTWEILNRQSPMFG